MREMKDFILSEYLPNYYDRNYSNLSFELDAELIANQTLLSYLDDWKVAVPNRMQIEKTINEYQDKYKNYNTRIYANKEYNLDELFDTFFMNLDNKNKEIIMNEYPQLKVMYGFDGKDYYKQEESAIKYAVDLLSNINEKRYNDYESKLSERRR
jgi:hypothetical protein